jgi:membrane protease YdiL (CAAX protease family)
LDQAAGGQLKGRWNLVLAFTVTWFFMVVGEELLWRGYILPRQTAQHGKYAWVVQGLLWNLFHLFKWWQLIALLPMTLSFAYASYRLKNNWPTMIAHFLGNLTFYVIVLLGVIGS